MVITFFINEQIVIPKNVIFIGLYGFTDYSTSRAIRRRKIDHDHSKKCEICFEIPTSNNTNCVQIGISSFDKSYLCYHFLVILKKCKLDETISNSGHYRKVYQNEMKELSSSVASLLVESTSHAMLQYYRVRRKRQQH